MYKVRADAHPFTIIAKSRTNNRNCIEPAPLLRRITKSLEELVGNRPGLECNGDDALVVLPEITVWACFREDEEYSSLRRNRPNLQKMGSLEPASRCHCGIK